MYFADVNKCGLKIGYFCVDLVFGEIRGPKKTYSLLLDVRKKSILAICLAALSSTVFFEDVFCRNVAFLSTLINTQYIKVPDSNFILVLVRTLFVEQKDPPTEIVVGEKYFIRFH